MRIANPSEGMIGAKPGTKVIERTVERIKHPPPETAGKEQAARPEPKP